MLIFLLLSLFVLTLSFIACQVILGKKREKSYNVIVMLLFGQSDLGLKSLKIISIMIL